MELVAADSSPLIALAYSGHIDVLLAIAKKVLITETVYQECTGNGDLPGAVQIAAAVTDGRITKVPDPDIGEFRSIDGLDIGEALAISQAKLTGAPILMDDAIGRQIARAHGIAVIGSCGILLAAKQRGLIDAVGPILDTWKSGLGYFLSTALVNEVLARAGERQGRVH